jgi:hypothetical protein
MVGGWKKLHNEELHNFYSSPNIIRKMKSQMRWAGHVVHMGDIINVYKISDGKPEGKRSFGRSRYRWEGNSRMDLGEIRWEVVDWTHLA